MYIQYTYVHVCIFILFIQGSLDVYTIHICTCMYINSIYTRLLGCIYNIHMYMYVYSFYLYKAPWMYIQYTYVHVCILILFIQGSLDVYTIYICTCMYIHSIYTRLLGCIYNTHMYMYVY